MRKDKALKDMLGISALAFIALGVYLNLEPAVVSAAPVTDDITVTQHVTDELTITSPADVNMSGTIYGLTGGTGNGSATWTVKTNNTTGFAMTLKADKDTNCLDNGASAFIDYVNGSPLTYNWTNPAVSGFGFTVEPATAADTVQAFKDNGSNTCNAVGGGNSTDTCWAGFGGTFSTPMSIISRSTATTASGEAEVVKFRAYLASGQFLPEGDYVAVITATATMN